jgi:hypothetical protein
LGRSGANLPPQNPIMEVNLLEDIGISGLLFFIGEVIHEKALG